MTYHERMACLETDMLTLARITIASSVEAGFVDTVGLEAAEKLLQSAVKSVLGTALEAYYRNLENGPAL